MLGSSGFRGLLLCCSILVGCEGCGDESAQPAEGSAATPSSAAGQGGERAGDPEGEPGPPPEVRVTARTDRYGRLTVAVENHGTEPTRLASTLGVQHGQGGDFEDAPGGDLVLAADCEARRDEDEDGEATAPDCVTLVPGAVLYPCECGGCDELEDGSHRFVARSCGGAHAVESAPVTLER